MIKARHVARMRDMRTAYEVLVGESAGDRTIRSRSHESVNNIKMDLKEIVWESGGCIYLGPSRGQ
jgi:hypothetical protein